MPVNPRLVASKPAHTKGWVMASGSKRVSASMAASATKAAAKPAQASA
jgi:hypothetical protein